MAHPEEDGDYSYLLKSTKDSFMIDEDLRTFDRIGNSLKNLTGLRQSKIDDSRKVLQNLSRKLELAKSSVESMQNSPSNGDHVDLIHQLDREKFALAKAINELESTNDHNSAGLIKLKRELEELIEEDVLDTATSDVEDSTLLKLKVFRSLGVSFDGARPESHTKALIQSSTYNNLYTLSLDKQYSNFFISNFIWDKM